jgi:hypothetical protein
MLLNTWIHKCLSHPNNQTEEKRQQYEAFRTWYMKLRDKVIAEGLPEDMNAPLNASDQEWCETFVSFTLNADENGDENVER